MFTLAVQFAQAIGQNFYTEDDILITMFEDTGIGLVELQCVSNSASPIFQGRVGPGTYYLRFEVDDTGGIYSPGVVSFAINNSVTRDLPFFSTPGTTTVPDGSGWTVVNGDVDDAIVCDPDCEFVFTSAGPTEATVLKSKADMSILKFKKNDLIAMAIGYDGDTPNATASTKVVYTDGTPTTTLKTNLTAFGQAIVTGLIQAPNVGTVKVKIKNKDTNAGDELHLQVVFINALRLGQTMPRGVLPLPPPAK